MLPISHRWNIPTNLYIYIYPEELRSAAALGRFVEQGDIGVRVRKIRILNFHRTDGAQCVGFRSCLPIKKGATIANFAAGAATPRGRVFMIFGGFTALALCITVGTMFCFMKETKGLSEAEV